MPHKIDIYDISTTDIRRVTPSHDESKVTMQRKMNTSQPRRSARIAARTPTVTISIRPSAPVKTSTGKTSQETGKTSQVKTRHSARTALRQRPNYYEAEEWEVEDPIYTSNTECRLSKDLPEHDHTKLLEDVARMKKVLGRAEDMSLPSAGRNRAVIDTLYWCRVSAYLNPMFPKFRATTRTKIREFEAKIASGHHTLSVSHRQELLEEIELNKEALANAHRSPWFVAAGDV